MTRSPLLVTPADENSSFVIPAEAGIQFCRPKTGSRIGVRDDGGEYFHGKEANRLPSNAGTRLWTCWI